MKEIIKTHLINKEKRVYSIIVSEYLNKIKELKSKYFIEWLAKELAVDKSLININSLNSSLARHKKNENEKK